MVNASGSFSRTLFVPLGAATALGVASTVGDWIWARYIPDGAVVAGVVHGVLIFILLALVLGGAAGSVRSTRSLLLTLPPTGLVIAAAFYPLAHALGYTGSLVVCWIAMWLSLALLQRRALDRRGALRTALIRGLLAALGSGLAFWAVSGMWTDPAGHSSYVLRVVYWIFAFFPGFLALLSGRALDEPDTSSPTAA